MSNLCGVISVNKKKIEKRNILVPVLVGVSSAIITLAISKLISQQCDKELFEKAVLSDEERDENLKTITKLMFLLMFNNHPTFDNLLNIADWDGEVNV